MRKHFAFLIFVSALLIAIASASYGADFPALTGRVVDEANLFTTAQEAEISQALADFESATKAQFVVAVVESTDGRDIMMYTTDLFNEWKLGQDRMDNGALLLIALNDRQTWITTGYGIEDKLTDSRCGDVYRQYLKPFFQEGRYFDGVKSALAAMMNFVDPTYTPVFSTGTPKRPASDMDDNPASIPLIIILFIVFSILGSIGGRSRNRRYWGRRGFTSGSFWGGFGGGGFGGGGGFSGGGGSSGGGGAGGGW